MMWEYWRRSRKWQHRRNPNVDCSIPIFNRYLDICYIYVCVFFLNFTFLLYFRHSKHPFCHLNGRVEAPTSDCRLVAWSLVPSERERLTRVFEPMISGPPYRLTCVLRQFWRLVAWHVRFYMISTRTSSDHVGFCKILFKRATWN